MPGEFRLDSWVVQLSQNTIECDGQKVHLEPEVIEVLVYLAENPDETVSKERLIRVVWRDTFVTDDVLNPLHLGAAGEERSWLGVCFMAPAC